MGSPCHCLTLHQFPLQYVPMRNTAVMFSLCISFPYIVRQRAMTVVIVCTHSDSCNGLSSHSAPLSPTVCTHSDSCNGLSSHSTLLSPTVCTHRGCRGFVPPLSPSKYFFYEKRSCQNKIWFGWEKIYFTKKVVKTKMWDRKNIYLKKLS